MPQALGGQSFFAFHIAPILLLVSAVSAVLPVSMPQLFAGFVGLSHGLLALAVFAVLVCGYGMRRTWQLVLATLASCAFAFNGLAIAIVRFPHFETFGAACLLLFFSALVLERARLAIVSFLFALATREDMGLHVFGFLVVWVALNWLGGLPRRLNVRLARFAIVALAYSTTVLLLQHWFFPKSSSFVRIYLGEPPLSHLSADLVTTRLSLWLTLHPAVILPAAAILVLALRTRDPYFAVGYVACIPWFLLHLLAVSKLAGLMVGYYAFPFLIAMAWPLFAGLISGRRETAGGAIRPFQPAIGLLALAALSLLPLGRDWDPGRITLPDAFLHPPSAEQQRLTDRAIAAIAAASPALGQLVVTESVAALDPFAFSHAQIAGWQNAPANTAVFFADGFATEQLGAFPSNSVHVVPGTEIKIVTDRPGMILRERGILP